MEPWGVAAIFGEVEHVPEMYAELWEAQHFGRYGRFHRCYTFDDPVHDFQRRIHLHQFNLLGTRESFSAFLKFTDPFVVWNQRQVEIICHRLRN